MTSVFTNIWYGNARVEITPTSENVESNSSVSTSTSSSTISSISSSSSSGSSRVRSSSFSITTPGTSPKHRTEGAPFFSEIAPPPVSSINLSMPAASPLLNRVENLNTTAADPVEKSPETMTRKEKLIMYIKHYGPIIWTIIKTALLFTLAVNAAIYIPRFIVFSSAPYIQTTVIPFFSRMLTITASTI